MTALRSARLLYKGVQESRRALVTCSSTLNGKRWHSSEGDGDKGQAPQIKAPRKKRRRPLPVNHENLEKLIGEPLQNPAGHLFGGGIVDDEGDTEILIGDGTKVKPAKSTFFIPQIALHEEDGREKKRVLV